MLTRLFFALLVTSVYAQQAQVVNLTCADVRSAVDLHNWGRLQIAQGKLWEQPAASNMNAIEYLGLAFTCGIALIKVPEEEIAGKSYYVRSLHLIANNKCTKCQLNRMNDPEPNSWDDELAEKAQKHAEAGKFEHNPDITVPSGRFTTGENLFMLSTNDPETKLNITEAITALFNEYKDYKYGALGADNFNNTGTGHYTQIVWTHTIYVGCGVSKKTEDGVTSLLYVCNYGPAGNIVGGYPYLAGEAVEGCENLCGRDGIQYGKNCPTK